MISDQLIKEFKDLQDETRATVWQHVKSGNVYKIQSIAFEEATLKMVIIYQGDDGISWSRPAREFMDGRFVRVS